MKKVLFIIFIAGPLGLFAQQGLTQVNIKNNTTSHILENLTNVNLAGDYHQGTECGHILKLHSDHSFENAVFDCMSQTKWDSGHWRADTLKGRVFLYGKDSISYRIIILNKFHFLVPEQRIKKFENEYATTWEEVRTVRTSHVNGIDFTPIYITGKLLSEKYFAKLPNDQ